MEFSNEMGKLQRAMAASSAGISRRQAMMNGLNLASGDSVLDIGCGGGHLLEEMAKSVGPTGRVFGLDPSADQIAQARERCSAHTNVELLESFANAIAINDNACDAIASTQTLEYIDNVDETLAEITRILKPAGTLANISILWDHFKFHGAEDALNMRIFDAFRAHCFHQMLPMELRGKLKSLGFRHVQHKPLAFVVTNRDDNSPANYTEKVMANFALKQGIPESDVADWINQLQQAEQEGRFGFTSFPVLTVAYLG